MKILLVGAGGVGSAFCSIASRRDFFEEIVVADYDLARAEQAVVAVDRRFSAAPNPLPGGTDKMDAGRRAELLGHTGELGRNILRQEAGKK